MFPHLSERIIMLSSSDMKNSNGGHMFDNRAVINALDKTAIMEKADIKHFKQTTMAGENEVEVKVTVAHLHSTQPIDNMIQSGQIQVLETVLFFVLKHLSFFL